MPPTHPRPPRVKDAQFVAGASRVEQLTRIIVRQISRWPLRSFTTCIGIAMSVAVLITALQWLDAIDHMVNVNFKQAQSQDVTVSFARFLAGTE